jgi:hypothetical protein
VHSWTLRLYCPCLYRFSFFCDSMWSCWVEANSCRYFIFCLRMYCRWRSSYQDGINGTTLTGLAPPHLCTCHEAWRGFPTSYVVGFFVLSVKVRGDCSFCYWLNCWPSLFKLSFHDFSYIVLLLPLTVNQLNLQRMSVHLFVIYNTKKNCQ